MVGSSSRLWSATCAARGGSAIGTGACMRACDARRHPGWQRRESRGRRRRRCVTAARGDAPHARAAAHRRRCAACIVASPFRFDHRCCCCCRASRGRPNVRDDWSAAARGRVRSRAKAYGLREKWDAAERTVGDGRTARARSASAWAGGSIGLPSSCRRKLSSATVFGVCRRNWKKAPPCWMMAARTADADAQRSRDGSSGSSPIKSRAVLIRRRRPAAARQAAGHAILLAAIAVRHAKGKSL